MDQSQTTLELQLLSAMGLKNVTLFTEMDVYAVVSVDDGTHKVKQETVTSLVRKGGTNPTFNYIMRFTLDDSLLYKRLSSLRTLLLCKRPLLGVWPLAVFHVSLNELFLSADRKVDMKVITSCQLWGTSGKPEGKLSFCYKFGDKLDNAPAKKVQPVKSYPLGASPLVQQKLEKKKYGTGCGFGCVRAVVVLHVGGNLR